MAGATDEILAALAASDLDDDVREVILGLLRDVRDGDPLAGSDRGPIRLTSIEVEGVRGIGPRSTLQLDPGAGLTLVVGPNGCGKSSFAEAAERAITGTTRRWEGSATDAREDWRNVHHGERARIRLGMRRTKDRGDSTIELTWGQQDDFTVGTRSVSGPSGGAAPGWLTAAWAEQLELHPPLLPYAELGAVIGGRPSDLFDQFDRLLGLGMLEDAARAAHDAARDAKALVQAVKQAMTAAAEACAGSSLDELRALAVQVRAKSADPGPILADLLARFGGGAVPASIEGFTRIGPVDLDGAARAVADLERVDAELLGLAEAQRSRATAAAELIERALEWHETGHDEPCPVCGTGTLDDAWRARAREAVDATAGYTAAVRDLRSQRARALDELRSAMPSVHGLVGHAEVPSSEAFLGLYGTIAGALSGAQPPRDVLDRFTELAVLGEACRSEAAACRDERAEAAQPVIAAIADWSRRADDAAGAADVATANTKAKEWLRARIQEQRDARLGDVSAQAQDLWSTLRATSTIDLGPISLNGANTRRRVDLTCTTEGAGAKARSVLSQGELHAVALALFLPRSLHPDSPFGFLMIDDPVQALDRMKVDGLAQVLHDISRHKQVIVFTHDDRLPDAVLRLGYSATVLRVQRGAGSAVSVSPSDDPATRAIRDAHRLAEDAGQLDPRLAARAVAGCCRAAVEARAMQLYRRNAARQGRSVEEIDDVLKAAGSSIWSRVSLALEGEVVGDLSGALRRRGRTREAQLIGRLNAGGHDRDQSQAADPQGLLEDTRSLLDGLLRS